MPPLGLLYVGGALEKYGFKVEIVDNYLLEKPLDHIKQRVKQLSPDIVGMTCTSVTYRGCIEIAKVIKGILPSCKIIAGGPHPSIVPESMLEHPEIDFVVMGEGERAVVALASHIVEGKMNHPLRIPGVAYKREGQIVRNAPSFITDLDEVPYPARHLVPMNLYDRMVEYLTAKPADLMNVARGCPYNCSFCEIGMLWGSACRLFSPSRVVGEIESLINEYGARGVYFIGDNFTVNKRFTSEICVLLKQRRFELEWACDARVDLVSRELLREMKAAGCQTIWFGVESGSPRILDKINKGVTPEQIVRAFRLCREEGIQTACSMMLGIPGERMEDLKATFKFVSRLDPDWCRFNIFIAVPGSSLYEEVMKKGLYGRMDDFVAFVKTEDFDFESISSIQRQFLKAFNRSPKQILRRVRREGVASFLSKTLRLS